MQTKAEQVLWQELRGSKLGYKFRRQVSIGSFVVDFYCHELHLIIELDGPIHKIQEKYDRERQVYLENEGSTVIRYTNDQVLFNREAVIEDILKKVVSMSSRRSSSSTIVLTPRPSPKREGVDRTPSPLGEGWGENIDGQRLNILYEDNHLIVVFKPSGTLVQEDDTRDPTLIDQVKYFLKQRDQKPGNVFLGMVHRLDRPVSGIILFAKTSKGAARLSEQFRTHTIEKVYHALVIGMPKKRVDHLTHYLKKEVDYNKVRVYDTAIADTQEARLSYEVVEEGGGFSLLKIHLDTGRPHQIRAQLSAIGHPIVGDVKYGAPTPFKDKSLALMATSLTFQLATKDEQKTVSLPVPEEWEKMLEGKELKQNYRSSKEEITG